MSRRTLWMTALLTLAVGVSLSADRVRLRSGKVVEGTFIGADSRAVRVLLDDGRVSEVAIITEVMGFTPEEDKAFWPIYREYDAEMTRLGDERVALIAEYAKNYDALTDEVADRLATKALELEQRRQGVKRQCFDRVKQATSARTALRFLQVEQQLQLLIDLQISASLPIAPTEAPPAAKTGR